MQTVEEFWCIWERVNRKTISVSILLWHHAAKRVLPKQMENTLTVIKQLKQNTHTIRTCFETSFIFPAANSACHWWPHEIVPSLTLPQTLLAEFSRHSTLDEERSFNPDATAQRVTSLEFLMRGETNDGVAVKPVSSVQSPPPIIDSWSYNAQRCKASAVPALPSHLVHLCLGAQGHFRPQHSIHPHSSLYWWA